MREHRFEVSHETLDKVQHAFEVSRLLHPEDTVERVDADTLVVTYREAGVAFLVTTFEARD